MNPLRFTPTAEPSRLVKRRGGQVVSIRDRGSAAILESRLRARIEVQARNKGGVVIG